MIICFKVDLIDQSGQIVGLAELDENQPFEKMKKFIKISAEFFLIVRKDEHDWELWSQMPEEKPLQKLIEKRLSELVCCVFKRFNINDFRKHELKLELTGQKYQP